MYSEENRPLKKQTVTTVICNALKYKFYLLSRFTMSYNIVGNMAP